MLLLVIAFKMEMIHYKNSGSNHIFFCSKTKVNKAVCTYIECCADVWYWLLKSLLVFLSREKVVTKLNSDNIVLEK